MLKGRVYRVDGRDFTCRVPASGDWVRARALGNLLKDGGVVVGDYVEMVRRGEEFSITKVLPRSNEVYRILVREQKRKVSASNIDYLVIVCSVSGPPYKRGLLDRYLVRAEQWDIRPLVVFNKMDQYVDSFDLRFELARLSYLEVPCFQVSSKGGDFSSVGEDSLGKEALRERLCHQTALLLGQSGVGKSSLISMLSGGKIVLKSSCLGRPGKGQHTTSWSEIVESGSLSLVDSPGIRSFAVDDIRAEDLLGLFPSLLTGAARCRFSDCQHLPDAGGCFFYSPGAFVSELEEKIILSYLESYHRLLSEVARIPSWKK